LAAGALTIPLSVALQKLLPGLPFMNRTGIAFWTCMVVCAVVSLRTRPKPEAELEGLIWTRDSLRLPPEMRDRMTGLRNPAVWWAAVTGIVLAMYVRYR
jgi:SSS family solute:Na+ symporter